MSDLLIEIPSILAFQYLIRLRNIIIQVENKYQPGINVKNYTNAEIYD